MSEVGLIYNSKDMGVSFCLLSAVEMCLPPLPPFPVHLLPAVLKRVGSVWGCHQNLGQNVLLVSFN